MFERCGGWMIKCEKTVCQKQYSVCFATFWVFLLSFCYRSLVSRTYFFLSPPFQGFLFSRGCQTEFWRPCISLFTTSISVFSFRRGYVRFEPRCPPSRRERVEYETRRRNKNISVLVLTRCRLCNDGMRKTRCLYPYCLWVTHWGERIYRGAFLFVFENK